MLNKIASVCIIAFYIAGCTMAPTYHTPEMPVIETIPDTQDTLSDKEQKDYILVAWKDFFKSENIKHIIEITLENNKDLRVAALNVKAAKALYKIERSDLLPKIDANASSSRSKVTSALSSTGSEYISSNYSANIASTAFELDLFGKLRSQNNAALETFFASKENQQSVQVILIAETANAYLQWLADKKILKLINETLNAQQKSYNLIAKSFKSGVASKLDLAQVRTSLETAHVNEAIYTRKVEQDKNALILLMGIKNSDEFFANQSLDDVKFDDKIPDNLSSKVLLIRPDIKKAEHELKAANADIGAARAAFFPTISLTGSLGFASKDLTKLFSTGAAGAWSFIPKISLPIFRGGENIANLEYSKIQKDIAIANYEKAIQTSFREVSDELIAKKTLKNELKAQRLLVEATKESYDLSYARYTKGIDSFLNVLDAQRSLFTAQQKEVEVEKLLLSNFVNLYKALGGGAVY